MGYVAKLIESSGRSEEEMIQGVDNAISYGSKNERKKRMKYIRRVENAVKSTIPPQHLDSILPELHNFVKICVMTSRSDEVPLKSKIFKCKMCGECCKESNPIVFTEGEKEIIIANYGVQESDNIIKAHLDDVMSSLSEEDKIRREQGYKIVVNAYKFGKTMPCNYLDEKTNKCKIYDSRPKNCSNFPFPPEDATKYGNYSTALHYYCEGEFEFNTTRIRSLLFIYTEIQTS
jgi:Fe-S-cluster containining protein